jgi:ribosomal-protein-alanine N-acetyltransferase
MKKQFVFSLMDRTAARTIQGWHYEEAYAIYNMGEDAKDAEDIDTTEMLDRRSPYYAVHDEQGELIGFFNVGTSALVWNSDKPGIYADGEDRTLAIGLGLRPTATGKGLGLAFVQACLDFARQEFTPQRFLLYVFPWNKRAIRVYERAGFQPVRSYVQSNGAGGHEFVEMFRDA